jgi:predicted kinase
LAASFGADLLSTDQIRRSSYGRSSGMVGYGRGYYRTEERDRVYGELIRRAEEILKDGRSVVLDGTFAARRHRQRAYDLGSTYRAVSLFVLCTCAQEVALTRIANRIQLGNSASEARADIYQRQLEEFEPLGTTAISVTIDSTRPLSDQLKLIYDELRRLLFG